jgi:hypothetical protein
MTTTLMVLLCGLLCSTAAVSLWAPAPWLQLAGAVIVVRPWSWTGEGLLRAAYRRLPSTRCTPPLAPDMSRQDDELRRVVKASQHERDAVDGEGNTLHPFVAVVGGGIGHRYETLTLARGLRQGPPCWRSQRGNRTVGPCR